MHFDHRPQAVRIRKTFQCFLFWSSSSALSYFVCIMGPWSCISIKVCPRRLSIISWRVCLRVACSDLTSVFSHLYCMHARMHILTMLGTVSLTSMPFPLNPAVLWFDDFIGGFDLIKLLRVREWTRNKRSRGHKEIGQETALSRGMSGEKTVDIFTNSWAIWELRC